VPLNDTNSSWVHLFFADAIALKCASRPHLELGILWSFARPSCLFPVDGFQLLELRFFHPSPLSSTNDSSLFLKRRLSPRLPFLSLGQPRRLQDLDSPSSAPVVKKESTSLLGCAPPSSLLLLDSINSY
jgi:hypothetical protein